MPSILAESIGEFLVLGHELLTRHFALIEPVFGFVVTHDQQRLISFCASPSASHVIFSLMMRSTALPDLRRLSAQAAAFVETENILFMHESVEVILQLQQIVSERRDGAAEIAVRSSDRGVEAFERARHAPARIPRPVQRSVLAVKSFTAIRICAIEPLNSRLAADTAAEFLTVWKASPTSLSTGT